MQESHSRWGFIVKHPGGTRGPRIRDPPDHSLALEKFYKTLTDKLFREMQKSIGFYRFFETRIILTGKFTEKNARIAFPLGFHSETPRGDTRATDSGSEMALAGPGKNM